jgi:MFS family permease
MSLRQANRNLTVMSATIFVGVFASFMWNSLLPLHLRTLGANDWEVGVAFTLMTIARALFAVVGGALADRFGRRLVLTLPHFACALLYILAGALTNWVALVAIFVLINALNALNGPAYTAIIAESVAEDRVARAYSVTEAAVLIGLIAGPLVGAALVPVLGLPVLISIFGVVLLGTTAVRFFGLVEPARSPRMAAPKVRAAIDARVRWYIVVNSLIAMAFGICFGPYFAILAHDAWRRDDSEINLLFALGNVAALGGIWLGRRADRWGNRRVLGFGLGVFALSVIGWGIAPTWEWGLVPLLIAFLFSEGAFIALQATQAEITTRETRGSILGVIITISGVIGGLGPMIAAGLIAFGGTALPFIACGALGLIAIAASGRIKPPAPVRLAAAEAE